MPPANKNKNRKVFKSHYLFWSIASAVLFLLITGFLLTTQSPQPTLVSVNKAGEMKIDSEIEIDFNWPVARKVELEVTPQVYGEIRYEDMLLNDQLARKVVFKPELTWLPGTTYQIKLSNVKNVLPSFRQQKEYVFTFTAEHPPVVNEVLPKQEDEIKPDSTWQVVLSKANNRLVAYEFNFDPAIEISSKLSSDGKAYFLQPANPLSQGQLQSLEIFKKDIRYHFGTEEIAYQGEPQSIWQGSWQVREAPGVEDFLPQGNNVSLLEDISVTFSENIDLESFKQNVVIEPELDGTWQTEDYKTVTFKPDSLKKETTYTVTINSGLKTYEGGYLEEDSVHSFTTLGPVKLISSFPADGNTGISVNSSIRLNFNQAVDHDSAESRFVITPEKGGRLTWDGETLVFTPDSTFAFNTAYTVIMSPGIRSVKGFDSEEEISFSFSTELSVTRLDVTFHRQEHNLSCEVATLVMALSYKGVDVSEATLIKAIGVDPTPKSNGVWGNPHIAFVGDIDGHQPSTGYGVYWQPIAAAAQNYREARWFTGWNISHLTNEIKKGNPVIVWGTAGSGSRIDWKTTEGGNVVAINGEHTRLVIGFIGSADNPTKIITLDPLSGEKYFNTSSFIWNWGLLNNSGVVVE